MSAVTVRVPAKVNLQLGVGPIRDDGYHDLVNVFHAVSLFDVVTAEPARELEVRVQAAPHSRVDVASVPVDDGNLAAQAARLVADRLGVEPRVALKIRKAIPVAGGMAGGSADAAAALVACARLWDDREQPVLSRDDLMEIGADLGSDVPFAVLGGTAVGVGRGERLTPPHPGHLPLGVRDRRRRPVHARRLRRVRPAPPGGGTDGAVAERLGRADDRARHRRRQGLGTALANDLQPAALSLRPALRRTLDADRDLGAIGALVSGSGPTCAFLAETDEDAADLAHALDGAGVAEQIVRASGPVPGATLV